MEQRKVTVGKTTKLKLEPWGGGDVYRSCLIDKHDETTLKARKRLTEIA